MTTSFFDVIDSQHFEEYKYNEAVEFSLFDNLMNEEEGDFLSSGTSIKSGMTEEDEFGEDDASSGEEELTTESITTPSLSLKLTVATKDSSSKPKRIRKRRNRKRLPPKSVAHLPEIRILKSDIRRRYADMVMKVMNNYDVSMMDSFLHSFCAPGFRFTEVIPKLPNSRVPNCIDGLENIIKSWAYCFEIMPDCVFHLYEAKFIRTLGQVGSRVVCKARLTGTKLYHATNPLIDSQVPVEFSVMQQICAVGNNIPQVRIKPHSSGNSSTSSLSSLDSGNEADRIVAEYEQKAAYDRDIDEMREVIELCYVPKPVKICVEGVFVFYLDENNLFTELRNDCEVYQEIDA